MPFEMMQKFSIDGTMPRVKEILKSGKLNPMSVSLPEISSVSWSSFMTGADPGRHGIFGFVELEPGGYQFRFPSFRDLKLPAFFDTLGPRGIRSVIINLPSTYPARQIPGVLISGFVVPDLKRAVFPGQYFNILKEFGYEVDVDATKGKDRKMEFLSDLHYILKVRKQVADFIWRKENWDLFMFTVTGTDRLHHFFFDASMDGQHPFHAEFKKYYQEIDTIIGDFYDRIAERDDCEFMMLSDHGFGLLKREVYINFILKNNGYFHTRFGGDINALDGITDNSMAFALDPSRIYIHLKGKYPRGKVEKSDLFRIRQELKNLFDNYTIDGEKVIQNVFFKEEIYTRDCIEMAPDLVLLSMPGYDLKAGLTKKVEHGKTHFTGMHAFDNALFFSTRPDFIPDKMTIFEVKNQIFRLLNVKDS
jgi:predicted AlkP superfamily phosphohydrolase/phosphomutase